MDVKAIHAEMLKVTKGCSASIMTGKKVVSLMWRKDAVTHQVSIKREECIIGSLAFNDAMVSAQDGLIY